jgi:dTDP-4-amino-4,6-dideoxygalactose transaminase
MQIPLVDLKVQYEAIKNEIDRAILNVITDGEFIGGKFVKQFEEEFAKLCRTKYCIGVGNGTDALYIVMRALDIRRGDEVITVANSFIATSEAITMTGARVIFADCDPKTHNIDIESVRAAITPRTKAILPVHLYGYPADMLALKKISEENGLFLVEDAAQAHGAEIYDRRVGTFGDAACFSFYPSKNLGAYGDAGAIVTHNEELALKCRMIANHGRIKKYDHDFEGINSRLDGLQAAILSVKLRHLEEWTEKRRTAATIYGVLLQNTEVITPLVAQGMRHVYHQYVVRVPRRDAVRATLKEKGIDAGIHYPIALPNLKAYRYLGYTPNDFPIATQYSGEILSLPMYPELTSSQIEYVCDQLKRAINP